MLENIPFIGKNSKNKEAFIRGVRGASLKSEIMMNEKDRNLKYDAMIILLDRLNLIGVPQDKYDTINNHLHEKSWSNVTLDSINNFVYKLKNDEFWETLKTWIYEFFPKEEQFKYIRAFDALNSKF